MNRIPDARSPVVSSRAHERARVRNTGKRAPLPDHIPRQMKRSAGRTTAPSTPAHIRVDGVSLDEHVRADIRRRLGEKLGKFAASIERVTVRVRGTRRAPGRRSLI